MKKELYGGGCTLDFKATNGNLYSIHLWIPLREGEEGKKLFEKTINRTIKEEEDRGSIYLPFQDFLKEAFGESGK